MGKAFAQTCAIALNDGTGFQSATQPLGHLHPHSPTADPEITFRRVNLFICVWSKGHLYINYWKKDITERVLPSGSALA